MNGELGDVEIQKWCNKQLEEANKSSRINSFKDKNLANAVIDLCDILSPGSADYRYTIITNQQLIILFQHGQQICPANYCW